MNALYIYQNGLMLVKNEFEKADGDTRLLVDPISKTDTGYEAKVREFKLAMIVYPYAIYGEVPGQ